MSLTLVAAFIAATALLVAIPGPNVAVIVANTLARGLRFGLATVAGTASAIALQLAIVVFAADLLLRGAGGAFEILRWLGVAYLLWLSFSAWQNTPDELAGTQAGSSSLLSIAAGGFTIGLSNPKTWLFYGAFFPQFVTGNGDIAAQIRVLAVVFFVVTTLLDAAWAFGAAQLRGLLATSPKFRQRLTAVVLASAALGLLLVRTTAPVSG